MHLNESVEVRTYTRADEQAVIEMWRVADVLAPQNDPLRDIARKLVVAPELFLVAEHDGQLVATVMGGYEGHRGWINYLAVHPDFRRQGIGLLMMNEVEQRLYKLGCPKVNLQVRKGNDLAIEFYRRIGYDEDEVVSFGKRLIKD